MRIFLDVGGHYGETLEVALNPRWGFERVYCFEPSEACRNILRRFRDPRLTVVDAGLSDKTQMRTLYGAGLLGASVYADKRQHESTKEAVALMRASAWLHEHTRVDDEVFLKLNCEGSEADILEDLLHTGSISLVRSVYVDFDVRKIPGQTHRQARLEEQLSERRVVYATPEQLGTSGSQAVRRWLTRDAGSAPAAGSRVRYALRLHRPGYVWATALARRLLPDAMFRRAARAFGSAGRRRRDREVPRPTEGKRLP